MGYNLNASLNMDGEQHFRNTIKAIKDNIYTLNSEMKAVTSAYDKNDTSAENLTAQNKVLNKQIEEQKNLLQELQKGLKAANDKYGEADTVTKAWQREVNQATANLNKMERQLTDNTSKMGGFSENTEKANTSTLKLSDNVSGKATASLITMGIAVAAITAGIGKMLMTAVNNADAWNTQAAIYGMTAEQIQELNYAGTKLDVSLETILGAQTKLTKSMYEAKDGTGEQAEAFKLLNVSITDTNGNLRSAQDVMSEAFSKLQNYGDETERDALTMKLFGKSAMELNPLIKAGGAELQRLTKEARATGAVISNETVDALDNFGDNMDALKIKMQATIAKGLTPLVPKIEQLADKAADANFEPFIDGIGWIIDHSTLLLATTAGIASGLAIFKTGSVIWEGIKFAKGLWLAYKTATDAATVSQVALNTATAASPVGLVAMVLGIAIGGLTAYALAANNATDAENEHTKSLKEVSQEVKALNDQLISNQKNRKDNILSIEAEYGANKLLAEKLYDLAEKENLSNAEKTQMKTLVDELNANIPNLNLVLDQQTGILSKQRDEVLKTIEAELEYNKVKAAQANLSKIGEDIFKKEYAIRKEQDERAKSLDRVAERERRLNEVKNDSNLKDREKLKQFEKIKKEYEGLDDAVKTSSDNLNTYNTELQDLNKEFEYSIGYINENKDALNEQGDTALKTADKVSQAVEQTKSAFQILREEYQKSIQDQADMIHKQYGLFDEFQMNTELSGKKLLNNLKSQVNGYYFWQENLKKLAEKGIDSNLLTELQKMGPQAAGEIAALTSLSKNQLAEYSKAWNIKNSLSYTIAQEQVSGYSQYQQIINYDKLSQSLLVAIRKLNLVVVLDGDKVGEVVDNRVGRIMYAK